MSPASPGRRTAPATASSSKAGACTRAGTSPRDRAGCWSPSSWKKASRPARRRSRRGAPGLTGPGAFHEGERGLKQLEVLLVLGRVGAVDLYPLSRARRAARLKRDDVVPRELQLGRGSNGQAQSDAAAADAGEHLVADEVGVEAVDLSCADAREFEKHSVDLCLTAGLGCIGIHGNSGQSRDYWK